MDTKTIVMCVVALIIGMLMANMLKDVCGCKVVEGAGWGDESALRNWSSDSPLTDAVVNELVALGRDVDCVKDCKLFATTKGQYNCVYGLGQFAGCRVPSKPS